MLNSVDTTKCSIKTEYKSDIEIGLFNMCNLKWTIQ